jgi:hypothetical protein
MRLFLFFTLSLPRSSLSSFHSYFSTLPLPSILVPYDFFFPPSFSPSLSPYLSLSSALRALAMDCLLPYSRRISDIATVMKRLRALETAYCPQSEDILLESAVQENLEEYKALVIHY